MKLDGTQTRNLNFIREQFSKSSEETVWPDYKIDWLLNIIDTLLASEPQPPAATFDPDLRYERRPLDAPDPEFPRKQYDWFPVEPPQPSGRDGSE